MEVLLSNLDDLNHWLQLALQVEHLFGPMAEDPYFKEALKLTIRSGNALCIRQEKGAGAECLAGGIIIAPLANEILWLAVAEECRGFGVAGALLETAIQRLDPDAPMWVQTFDRSVFQGRPARRLYHKFGFVDAHPAAINPVGIPTVMMSRGIRGHGSPSF